MHWIKRLVWLEPFWVFGVAPFLLLPGRFIPASLTDTITSWQPYALGVLGLGFLLRWVSDGRPTRPTPINLPILLMLLWLPVNYWAAVDKALALDALGYLLFGVAVFFALINWPPFHDKPERTAWFILIIGLGLTLAAPFLSSLGLSSLFQIPRAAPIFQRLAELTPGNVNENRMAGTLVLFVPLFLASGFARQQSWWKRALLIGSGLLILALLILSQSRGALLAVGGGLALLVMWRWPKMLWGIPVAIGAVAYTVYKLGPDILISLGSNGDVLGGFDGRLEIWSRAIYASQDFSFTGVGIGNFQKVIPILYPYFMIAPDTIVEHAHNLWLQIIMDLGFPGLIAVMTIFLLIIFLLSRIIRRRKYDLNWSFATGTLAGLSAMFIHGIIDAPVWGSKPAFVVWLFIALSVQLVIFSKSHHSSLRPQ